MLHGQVFVMHFAGLDILIKAFRKYIIGDAALHHSTKEVCEFVVKEICPNYLICLYIAGLIRQELTEYG